MSKTAALVILIILAAAIIGLLAYKIANSKDKKKLIKEWCLGACIEAEKALGSKTGEAKLLRVYDAYTKRFPILSILISYETFINLVDAALDELKTLLSDETTSNLSDVKTIEGGEN